VPAAPRSGKENRMDKGMDSNDATFFADICELAKTSRAELNETKIRDQIKHARIWIRQAAQRGEMSIRVADGRPEVALHFTTLGFNVDTSAGTHLVIGWE